MTQAKDYSLLYKTIFQRKSVRRYDMAPLDDEVLIDISNFISRLEPMKGRSKIETRIVAPDKVKTGIQPGAPHYVAIYADKLNENYLNIGFMFQQLSLYLTARGIGSCWLGIPEPTTEIKEYLGKEFLIFISFGKAKESLFRKERREFSRKSFEEITNIKNLEELIEPARLAPSATNNQPWYFTTSNGMVHVHCKVQKIIKKFLVKKYNMMDIGIAISHLWLTARHKNKNVVFLSDESSEPVPDYYYVTSLKIE